MIIASFLFFLLIFVGIGAASTLKSDRSNSDYLLAGRKVSPWLVGFSAMATNNSGYMFIGAIGYTYAVGLQSFWFMFAWMFGDFLASFFIHRKMRVVSEERRSLSFGAMVSSWGGADFRHVRILAGVITVLFLGAYAAAQFKAGGKALHVIFGWENWIGAVVGSIIVLIYCLAGGIRASIWTDAAQTLVMFLAMSLMLVVGLNEIGGLGAFFDGLGKVGSGYLSWFSDSVTQGGIMAMGLFVLGCVLGGIGIVAQPHVMVRFMALDDEKHMLRARATYYGLYLGFCILTFSTGLAARLLFPDTTAFDSELALPNMATRLLPEILIGLVLAGIFSASMSTADSQILSCSSALTSDIAGRQDERSAWVTKGATLVVTTIALVIAVKGFESVFKLVLFSWSVLASAFAPLIIVQALGRRLTQPRALAIMILGVTTCLVWRALGWGSVIYEAGPAMILAVATHFMLEAVLGPPPER
ncbi:MAG: sodium/proline symporter [Acidobacteriota bacterium]